jgi:Zn-dependent protease with chaperone function
LEDFQRPLDQVLTVQLDSALQTGTAQWLDSNLIKPYLDDISTAQLAVSSLELREGQLPDRPELSRCVDDCARILGMKPPRVFVSGSLDRPAVVEGIADPKIIISSLTLTRLTNEKELRFIIGRQLGHILANHVRWQFVTYNAINAAQKTLMLPNDLAAVPLIPLLKWSREAEMTADRAGLICAQDLGAAEQALLRTEIGIRENINTDLFLSQTDGQEGSKFSETVLLWKGLIRPQPFLNDRIKQMRTYAHSVQYTHLWQ